MGLVMSEPRYRPPFIPMGCTQQGRDTPTKLRKENLERQIEAKAESRSLPDLLLAKGSMSGPFRRTHPVTRWSQALKRFHRALLAVLAPRNH